MQVIGPHLLALVAAWTLAFVAPSAAQTFKRVTISNPAPQAPPLVAHLAMPIATKPVPVVIGLHGCSGMIGPEGGVLPIYRAWVEIWTAAGYAVLLPDSFGSRGKGQQCTVKDRILPRDRVVDVVAAARWVKSQPALDGTRMVLLGWSHGGSATLASVRRGVDIGPEDFRTAIAFYPGCRGFTEARDWATRLPLHILIGAADDWTPPAPCRELGRRDRIRIVEYPDAYHAFDHPSLPIRVRTGLTVTPDGSGRAHVGSNATARAAAIAEVGRLLAEAFR